MASIVGKAVRGFGKALKHHKAKRAASKKVHFDYKKGKPFPKKTQKHMRKQEIRHLGMKKEGYKQEPYGQGRVNKGRIELKETWSYNPYKKRAKGGQV